MSTSRTASPIAARRTASISWLTIHLVVDCVLNDWLRDLMIAAAAGQKVVSEA